MRKTLGFSVVLAAAYLTGTVGVAFGQGAGRSSVANTATQDAVQAIAPGTTTAPGQATGIGAGTGAPNYQVPGTAGSVLNQAGVTGTGATPGTAAMPGQATGIGAGTGAPNYQVPGTAGTILNQAGVTGTNTAASGTVNAGTAYAPAGTTYSGYPTTARTPGVMQGTYPANVTAATPGYAGRAMPGMTGYNSVNPMGTTMAPGYYYAGTAGTPYTTYTPANGTNSYYTSQPYVMQRRGLFGRRNRIAYPASPYGTTTYQTAPPAYTTYGTTTYYSTPGVYNYGNPTYTTPGTYQYGRYPY